MNNQKKKNCHTQRISQYHHFLLVSIHTKIDFHLKKRSNKAYLFRLHTHTHREWIFYANNINVEDMRWSEKKFVFFHFYPGSRMQTSEELFPEKKNFPKKNCMHTISSVCVFSVQPKKGIQFSSAWHKSNQKKNSNANI